VTCGIGDQEKTRNIQTQAANGGNECQGPNQESQACNTDPCPTTTTIPAIPSASGSASATLGGSSGDAAATAEELKKKEEEKKQKMMMLGGGASVGIFVIAVAAYFMCQPDNKPPAEGIDGYEDPVADYGGYDDGCG